MSFTYRRDEDVFAASLKPPIQAGIKGNPEVDVILSGALAGYMGFGSRLPLALPRHKRTEIAGASGRLQPPGAFGAIQCGDPTSREMFAEWVQAALNRYDFPDGFTFDVQVPGAPAVSVAVPPGRMTLSTAAVVINSALAAAGLAAIEASHIADRGIGFASTDGSFFSVDWTADPDFDPARLGYDRRVYPACPYLAPTRPPLHVPSLGAACEPCGQTCVPPLSNVTVTYREQCRQVALSSTPFPPLAAEVTVELACGDPGMDQLRVVTPGAHGLQVGAAIVIVDAAGGEQQSAVVIEISDADPTLLFAVRTDHVGDASLTGADLTMLHVDKPPLDLYLQRHCGELRASSGAGNTNTNSNSNTATATTTAASTRPNAFSIDATKLGFQPVSYEACTELVSPGTVMIHQSLSVVLCLGFSGTNCPPVTGNLYYPFEHTHQLVFAKIVRAAFLRSDFDRLFEHKFLGSGTNLGYIRVRILNPDGTLYQTHGHQVSITLRFLAFESWVALGGGHVTSAATSFPPGETPRGVGSVLRGQQPVPYQTQLGRAVMRGHHVRPHPAQMGSRGGAAPVQGGHHGPR